MLSSGNPSSGLFLYASAKASAPPSAPSPLMNESTAKESISSLSSVFAVLEDAVRLLTLAPALFASPTLPSWGARRSKSPRLCPSATSGSDVTLFLALFRPMDGPLEPPEPAGCFAPEECDDFSEDFDDGLDLFPALPMLAPDDATLAAASGLPCGDTLADPME